MGKTRDPIIRFTEKWKLSTEHFYNGEPCWEWTSPLMYKGYGRFYGNGKHVLAHRWSYEHYRGPIPDGLQIDHLCRVRHCVNFAHMEVVTGKVNTRRGMSARRNQPRVRRTHCPQGHPYNEENTSISSTTGWQDCRICRRETSFRYKERKRTGMRVETKMHCRKGHPYNEENTRIQTRRNGRPFRVCRACKRENDRHACREFFRKKATG